MVARTPWCVTDATVPVVGTLLDVDVEALVLTDPTVVLVQPPVQGNPPHLADLSAKRGWNLVEIRINSFDDIGRAVGAVADALEPVSTGPLHIRADECMERLTASCAPIESASQMGGVALLSSVRDNGALGFGEGSYLAQAVERMGCHVAPLSGPFTQLSLEEICALEVSTLIICDANPDERVVQGPLSKFWIVLAPHESLLMPSPSLVDGLELMRRSLVDVVQLMNARREATP